VENKNGKCQQKTDNGIKLFSEKSNMQVAQKE